MLSMHPKTTCSSYEIRICTNKTCRRQGSKQILQFAKDLALSTVNVVESGCFGACGNGPSIAIIPLPQTNTPASASPPILEQPLMLHHISTPVKFSNAIEAVCGIQIDDLTLQATQLRLAGNAAAVDEDYKAAISFYTKALQLNPPVGTHLLLSNRSAARLASGDAENALLDAVAAVECAPPEFTTAGVRHADALFALKRYDESLMALKEAGRRHPPYMSSQEYTQLENAIRKMGASSSSSSSAQR